MASLRTISFVGLALLAILGGATARKDPDYSPPTYDPHYSPPKYEEPKEKYYSPPPPQYEEPKDKEYYPPPPPKYEEPKHKYYSPPPPKYDDEEYPEYSSCEEYADECDFKFHYGGIPTFHLIEHGDNAYGPIIVDKYDYPTKVLNPNGECKVFDDDEDDDHSSYEDDEDYSNDYDCKDNFYFQHNRVATRTFNIRPVKEFRGKCIRLDITSAQLWDNTNLNPYDGNEKYPEDRRCVIFRTA